MAISYPLALPTSIGLESITFSAVNAVTTSQSPFSYKQQVVSHTGQRWEANVSIPPVRRQLAAPWNGFLTSLKGQVGTFLLGDPDAREPQGLIKNASNWFLTGGVWNDAGVWDDTVAFDYDPSDDIFANPFVNGNQLAGSDTLSIKGIAINLEGVFKAGDYIQLGNASTATLHKVLQDADSNSSGVVVLDIWPSLRRQVNDNEVVTYRNTVGLFRLKNNGNSYQIGTNSAYGISFDCVEVIT